MFPIPMSPHKQKKFSLNELLTGAVLSDAHIVQHYYLVVDLH